MNLLTVDQPAAPPGLLQDGLTVVIPAFNEEQGLGPVMERLLEILCAQGMNFEVIVIDDGSTDQTPQVASAFTGRYPVRVITHGVNKGYGASLKSGVRAARYELIVMMDSDGQHDPHDVLRVAQLAEQNDMVVGARTGQSYAPPLRKPGKWLLRVVANYLAGCKIPDLNSGLRAFRRELVLRFAPILPNGFSFTTTLTLACMKEHYKVAWVPIVAAKRSGHSTVNPLTDGYNTLILILRTIVLFDPLKVFLPPALALGVFGVLFSMYGLVRYGTFPDSGVVVIIAAVLLFFMGILADSISALRLGLRS